MTGLQNVWPYRYGGFAADQVPEAPRWQKTGVLRTYSSLTVAKWTPARFAI